MHDPVRLLICGGTILDPVSGRRDGEDLLVVAGRVVEIGSDLRPVGGVRVLDASGCLVVPGLVDLHVHSYWGVNPFGKDLDETCLATGVTTAVDAGSAGPVNLEGFRALVHDRARTRMLAFVSLAQHGVWKDPGELEDLRFADPDGTAAAISANRDLAVGVKVRLHRPSVGENGREALRLAIRAGEMSATPVMVHVGNTGISMEEIAAMLRPGDIITHCYTPQIPSVLDERGRLRRGMLEAQARGVIFDVGHANNHFVFDLVRRAMGEGLLPDVISTDLHGRLPATNPVVDLPTTMTKLLALGLPIERVIEATTTVPARAIGWGDRIGRLEAGHEADITVLQLRDEPIELRDSLGSRLVAPERITVRWTIRAGRIAGDPA